MVFTPTEIALYEAEGEVHSILEFIDRYLHLLQSHEQQIVRDCYENLLPEEHIPAFLQIPLTRAEWLQKNDRKTKAHRAGDRSAFHPEWKVNLKGCRPTERNNAYGNMVWNFEEVKLHPQSEAFGVLSPEDVMREILAFAFMKKFKIPNIQTPICVFEYFSNGQSKGYCLAIGCETDLRLENLVDLENIPFTEDNKQVGFKNIDFDWYVQRKTELMIEFHFNGGFRNYTNCNYGNEIVVFDNNKVKNIFLTDFDKFSVVEIPQDPDYAFIEKFYLTAFMELLESATPIYNLPHEDDDQEMKLNAARDLIQIYLELDLYEAVKIEGENEHIGLVKKKDILEPEQAMISQSMLKRWSPLYRTYERTFIQTAFKDFMWEKKLLEKAEKESISNIDYQNRLIVSVFDKKHQAIKRARKYHHRHN